MTYEIPESVIAENNSWREEVISGNNFILPPVFDTALLESFAFQNHIAIGLYDHKRPGYTFRTSNFPALLDKSITDLTDLIKKEIIPFIVWGKRPLIRLTICGNMLPKSNGCEGRSILQSIPVVFDDRNYPVTYLNSVRNIPHLIMGEGLWMRVSVGNDNFSWFSGRDKFLKHNIISAREKEVIRRLALGQHLACIAEELGISINTVKNHLKSCCARLRARNNTALVQLCVLSGAINVVGK